MTLIVVIRLNHILDLIQRLEEIALALVEADINSKNVAVNS
tara:strand:+ start:296 stop:418 length:123 start_codon:yes stop_codon:yes gene_type:complete